MLPFLTILQAPVRADTVESLTKVGLILICVVTVPAVMWAITERRRRQAAESQFARLAQAQTAPQLSDRDAAMYEQHKRMNDLQIEKLAAEVQLLKAQSEAGIDIADRHEASKEYHELMVEKTRLEMDVLRLQIAEHRRRMEDWRTDD